MNRQNIYIMGLLGMLSGALFGRFMGIVTVAGNELESTFLVLGAAIVVGFMIWYSQQ